MEHLCFQRKKKPRLSAGEERREREAIKALYLEVAAGTMCGVCKQAITKAADRLTCDVCEQHYHRQCRDEHADDCVVLNISFNKAGSSKKPAKRRTR